MSIISISINDKLLEDVDNLQKELGFSGRSEILRAALRNMISEHRSNNLLDQHVEAALVVIHNEADIHNLKHDFSDIIKTQVHNHIKGKCLELFVVSGNSKKITSLVNSFKKIESVESVKIISS